MTVTSRNRHNLLDAFFLCVAKLQAASANVHRELKIVVPPGRFQVCYLVCACVIFLHRLYTHACKHTYTHAREINIESGVKLNEIYLIIFKVIGTYSFLWGQRKQAPSANG